MDRNEIRAVTIFFYLEEKTATEIKSRLDAVHEDSSPSFFTVWFWILEFKRDRTHTNDEPRSGHPKADTTPEIVERIHDIALVDRRVKVREIDGAVGISYERGVRILHNE